MKLTDKIEITNEDNMLLMARYPDNYFDLAIVDPPYGIKIMKQWGNSDNDYRQFDVKEWDNNKPTKEYFNELFRVSKNQIVWGGNYFSEFLPSSQGWVIWDKGQENFTLADAELGWTSFNKAIRRKKIHRSNKNNPDRIHICQKPVALYKWLLDKYGKPNDKILDTHLGSGSIAIACADYGFELTACELDKEYYDKAIQRIQNHLLQQKLF
jgi:site-specific DNA-methyltransferase (adenine-specific)